MASTHACIRLVNIIFTNTETIIGDTIISPSGPNLKIQIIPNDNGKDIAELKMWYSNSDSIPSRLNEELTEFNLFKAIAYAMNGDGDTLFDRAASYMRTIPFDEVAVIMKEYTKNIEDGILLDGFIAGIGAYIAFLLLNENNIFMNQMPFQFGVPCTVNSGNSINKNMFQYLSLPLTALAKVAHGVLLQLVVFIQSFINMWEPAFNNGPIIGSINEARMCMEVIGGFSQHIISSLAQTKSHQESVVASLNSLENNLQVTVNESIHKMQREINNLLIETRTSIKDLTENAMSQLTFIDDTVKLKISENIENNLNAQVEAKIVLGIEESRDRIKEIVRYHTQNEGTKLLKLAVDERESELKGTLVGLEHRIEILYNKLDSAGSQNHTDTQNNDNYQIIDSEISTPDTTDGACSKSKSNEHYDTNGPLIGETIYLNSNRSLSPPNDPKWNHTKHRKESEVWQNASENRNFNSQSRSFILPQENSSEIRNLSSNSRTLSEIKSSPSDNFSEIRDSASESRNLSEIRDPISSSGNLSEPTKFTPQTRTPSEPRNFVSQSRNVTEIRDPIPQQTTISENENSQSRNISEIRNPIPSAEIRDNIPPPENINEIRNLTHTQGENRILSRPWNRRRVVTNQHN